MIHMFDFSRRINGVTYYVGLAITYALTIFASILIELVGDNTTVSNAIIIPVLILVVAFLIYTVCIIRQRANDIGWHPLLITFIALFTPLPLFLGLISGQKSENDYGPTPRKGVSLKP